MMDRHRFRSGLRNLSIAIAIAVSLVHFAPAEQLFDLSGAPVDNK